MIEWLQAETGMWKHIHFQVDRDSWGRFRLDLQNYITSENA